MSSQNFSCFPNQIEYNADMKKVLMVLAEKNFRDIEYIVPRAFFEQAGITVKTASVKETSLGRFGFKVQNDFLIPHVSATDFDGIFLVGGNGSLDFLENEDLQTLTENFLKNNKLCGAICAAPRLLLQWGLMKNKKCTGWNGDGEVPILCEKYDAIFEDSSVVFDQKVVTGNGPKASEETALKFIENL